MTSRDFQERLVRRARRAGISISAELGKGLEAYYRLLAIWNAKINLTGLDLADPSPETLDRLLIEPVVAARHIPPDARTLVDVGSGGGSPAIPFALASPRLQLLMVESKTRKSIFLKEAIRTVGLTTADVATSRFEELQARPDLHEAYDLLTIRAVRVDPQVLTGLQALVRPGGQLFLFRAASGSDSNASYGMLTWKATYPLVGSLSSRLIVLQK